MSLKQYLFPRPPHAVMIGDGVVGHEKQSRALLALLGISAMQPSHAPADLIVSTGRRAAVQARTLWRAQLRRPLWVQILKPTFGELDLLIVPSHDGITGENVLNTLGALVHLDPDEASKAVADFARAQPSAAAPYAAILLGQVDNFAPVLAAIQTLHARGFFLLVSTSRRSQPALHALLRAALNGLPHALYDGNGDNPLAAYLALAEHIVLSNDSINMRSEAIATSARVTVLETTAVKLKHWRALDTVKAWQRLSALDAKGAATPLDDSPFVAMEVARRLLERLTLTQ